MIVSSLSSCSLITICLRGGSCVKLMASFTEMMREISSSIWVRRVGIELDSMKLGLKLHWTYRCLKTGSGGYFSLQLFYIRITIISWSGKHSQDLCHCVTVSSRTHLIQLKETVQSLRPLVPDYTINRSPSARILSLFNTFPNVLHVPVEEWLGATPRLSADGAANLESLCRVMVHPGC